MITITTNGIKEIFRQIREGPADRTLRLCEKKNEEIVDLKHTIDSLHEANAAQRDRIAELEEELQDITDERDAQIDNLNEQYSQIQEQSGRLMNDCTSMGRELERLRAYVPEDYFTAFNSRAVAATDYIVDLRSQIASLEKELQDIRSNMLCGGDGEVTDGK